MDTVKLAVQERTERGDGPSRRMRAGGLIPGVVYGKGSSSTAISVALEDLKAATAHGHNVVLELDLNAKARAERKGGKGRPVPLYAVVKELQFHPTRRQLLHVDLHEVDLDVEIEASVAIELTGTPAGAVDGGVLDWVQREVTVKALPNAVPAGFELDVSELTIGHHITVAALVAGEGVTIVDDPETMIAALLPPRVVEEEEPTVSEEPEQPEVIGGKSEEE
jgi:large subunit ribosomal protein L25